MNLVRKIVAYLIVLVLALGVFAILPHKLSAKEGDDRNSQETKIEKEQAGEEEENEMDVEEEEHEEEDVHHHLDKAQDKLKKIEIVEAEEDNLATYGDVISVLKKYQSVLDQIKNAYVAGAQPKGLNDQEKLLLDKLLGKHSLNFNKLNDRISEINAQILDLINLLTPLSSQTISESFNLKKLLVSELKEFREQIKDLVELEDLDFEVVDSETL